MEATTYTLTNEPWYHSPPAYKGEKRHVVIIGGGLAGTSAAYSFAQRGWKVTLIERHETLAAEASGNPAGILMPLLASPEDKVGRFIHQAYRFALTFLTPLGVLNPVGVLQLQGNRMGKVAYKQWQVHPLLSDGLMQYVNADQASVIAGIELTAEAAYYPQAGWACPSALCRRYIDSVKASVQVRYCRQALSLERHAREWHVKDKEGLIAKASVLVIANAADAAVFEQTQWLPLRKVRGQITYLPATPLSQQLKTVLCYEGYMIPCGENKPHVIGATFGVDDSDPAMRPEDHQENLAMLKPYVPKEMICSDEEMNDGRVAFRAVSPDRRPMVGAVPDYQAFMKDYADIHHGNRFKAYPKGTYHPGLYVSVGHGSRGLVTTAICAELIAAQVAGETLPLDASMANLLNPARFLIKQLKQGKIHYP